MKLPRLAGQTFAAALFCGLVAFPAGSEQATRPAPRPRPPSISADALRGHVSFLASDELEGRLSPGRGADIAAEYIASRFRADGLEEAAPGYFQRTEWLIEFSDGEETVPIRRDQIIGDPPPDLLIFGVPKVILTTVPGLATFPRAKYVATGSAVEPIPGKLVVNSEKLVRLAEKVAQKNSRVRAIFVPPGLKNVIGVLRGKTDEYVILSAHYDHVGTKPDGEGDRIFNGANDNASSVAALIEIASSLSRRGVKPRRSIVFATFFGEEEGFIGSRYYARSPLFPIRNTVAQLNLEQLGRTDDTAGARRRAVVFTGFSFTNIPAIMARAGALTGVRVQDPGKVADEYFDRSDNEALANLGVPSQTLGVAFEFPDYHKVSDEWQKLDYDNMAAVSRFIAAGAWALANNPQPPQWNTAVKDTEAYVEARRLSRSEELPKVSVPGSESSPPNRQPPQSKPSPPR